MIMSKIVSAILLFILSTLVYAIDFKSPSYDKIPITPRTWQEVDLSYSDIIKGKSYPAEIKLLRPIEWLEENGMDKVGNEVNLSIPEFGVVNVQATVTAIKPTTLDTSKTDWSKIDSRPVIGTFKRYARVVNTYTFKDLSTGKISSINATPNHPFYVKNKNKFIPIENVSPTDQLINSSGQPIKLICGKGQNSHCGRIYNIDGTPVPVYNLEIYQRHVYFVGNTAILVHNVCVDELIAKDHGLSQGARDQLTNFNHIVSKSDSHTYQVASSYRDVSGNLSEFINEYNINSWYMLDNERFSEHLFHMNDVVRKQYLIAAKEGDFLGGTPNTIIRYNITNKTTIDTLQGLESGTQDFLNTFLTRTPNGKSTSYIMKDFNLLATNARWVGKSIHVEVKPIWRPWE